MSASAWNPSGQVTQITGITIKSQSFTAVASQTLFAGTNQYTPGLNQLEVTKNGVWLSPAQVVEDVGGFAFSVPACTAGDVIVARVFIPTTDAFQSLATASQNSANASATSAASAAAILASIQGLTGTVIGSGNLTFAGSNQKILGDVGLNVTRDVVTTGNVGIGTAVAPSDKLQVVSNGAGNVVSRYLQPTVAEYWQGMVSGDTSFYFGAGSGYTTKYVKLGLGGDLTLITPAGLGYGTGAGGTVTQATSKSTAVTLNKPCGQITMNAEALGAGRIVVFNFNNSVFALPDLCIAQSYGWASYRIAAVTAAPGVIQMQVTNLTAGTLSDAVIISFAIIKGAVA